MRFAGEMPSGNAKVKIYRFAGAARTGEAYVVWCPTSDGTTLAHYTLILPEKPTAATLVTLTAGQPSGAAAALIVTAGRVSLAVSERPLIVLVRHR